jgi:hypothetical protein
MVRIVIASLLALAAAAAPSATTWGGDHIEMQVTDRGATIEFDCAHGTIDGPIAPDSNGQFTIAGTFSGEHAGPVREGDSQTRSATYAGSIKDDAMALRISFAGKDAPSPMTFDLVRGRAGRVRKCR